jgi:hypothetical protein
MAGVSATPVAGSTDTRCQDEMTKPTPRSIWAGHTRGFRRAERVMTVCGYLVSVISISAFVVLGARAGWWSRLLAIAGPVGTAAAITAARKDIALRSRFPRADWWMEMDRRIVESLGDRLPPPGSHVHITVAVQDCETGEIKGVAAPFPVPIRDVAAALAKKGRLN